MVWHFIRHWRPVEKPAQWRRWIFGKTSHPLRGLWLVSRQCRKVGELKSNEKRSHVRFTIISNFLICLSAKRSFLVAGACWGEERVISSAVWAAGDCYGGSTIYLVSAMVTAPWTPALKNNSLFICWHSKEIRIILSFPLFSPYASHFLSLSWINKWFQCCHLSFEDCQKLLVIFV